VTITVPTLTAEIAHDAPETLVGTLAPTGGVGPYVIVAIWPAGPATDFDPDRVALAVWRGREARPAATWRTRAARPAAAWRGREIRPEATWT